MNNQFEIIDNFLEPIMFNKLVSIMYDENFPWYYHESVTNENDNKDSFYFTHLFYWKHEITSAIYKELIPVIEKLKCLAIIRIKANLYPNVNKFIKHDPHTDFPYQHKGAILYINTNNGLTIIDEQYEIKSVANRMLIFNPSVPHSSTNCTDSKSRININFNYF